MLLGVNSIMDEYQKKYEKIKRKKEKKSKNSNNTREYTTYSEYIELNAKDSNDNSSTQKSRTTHNNTSTSTNSYDKTNYSKNNITQTTKNKSKLISKISSYTNIILPIIYLVLGIYSGLGNIDHITVMLISIPICLIHSVLKYYNPHDVGIRDLKDLIKNFITVYVLCIIFFLLVSWLVSRIIYLLNNGLEPSGHTGGRYYTDSNGNRYKVYYV